MARTNLFGPHTLDKSIMDLIVRGKGPGAYALERRAGNSFTVNYVGRSDDDLNQRLKQWCGDRYKRFKYAFFETAKASFNKECQIWHDFGGTNRKLDNEKHPERSAGKDWQCPVCDIFKSWR